MTFDDLSLNEQLKEGLRAMNFETPTPVQEQTIPVILEKRDVISCAQTGTGKTAAFLLPLLDNLLTDKHDVNKINAIIMAPTRELAQQIDQQMEGFSYFVPISSVAVYGGNDAQAWDVQRNGLTKGADVVIATPGRLLSHINLQNLDFSGVKYLILDEADRMLDMGFFDDIMRIVKLLPADRQTIMFSATMPPKIRELAKTILNNPAEIKIAIARPPDNIMQAAYLCTESQKIPILKQLFSVNVPNKVIIFAGKKQRVRELALILKRNGLGAEAMHSDLEQRERDHVMHEFRNGRVNVLVATDIVARGIDIDDITLIINYEVPRDVEDYVHRIGRTARAEAEGMAITLVSETDQFRFKRIEDFLEKTIYKIPLPAEIGTAPAYDPKPPHPQQGKFNRSGNKSSTSPSGKKRGGKQHSRQKHTS
ncbi:RNA helicase [Bacteroidia bacterium]|nr:RNA helicase [Bacteroidia bacterium]